MKTRRPYYRSLRPLLDLTNSACPVPWAEMHPPGAPLHVEIGFGNGEYLSRQAAAHPDRLYVGFEERWASVRRALRRADQVGARNLRILQSDARIAFPRAFAPRTVAEVLSLFPCPWRKEKSVKHRLFHTSFLRTVNSRLCDDGAFTIVTDYRPLLDWTLEQVPGSGMHADWQAITPRFGTKYERKWLAQGSAEFFQLTLRKVEHMDVPPREEVTMESVKVAHFDPDSFEAPSLRGAITMEPKAFLYDPKQEVGMLRVVVVEDDLTQTFWIRISRSGDVWSVKPSYGCSFLPTVGVRDSLAAVRDAIQGQSMPSEGGE